MLGSGLREPAARCRPTPLLAEALDRFEKSPRLPERHRALLRDTGPFLQSSPAVRDLTARAVANEVAVYVIRFSDGPVPDTDLDELANRTGGLVVAVDDTARLGAAYRSVLVDLESLYQLRFRLPEPGPGPEEVVVTVEQAGVKRSTTVALPARMKPAGQPGDQDDGRSRSQGVELPQQPDQTGVTLLVAPGALAAVIAVLLFARLWVGVKDRDD